MTNMSYCRFENTVADLRDCIEQVEALLDGESADFEPLTSDRERLARLELIELCMDVASRFADEGVELDHHDPRDAIQSVLSTAEQAMPEPEEVEPV